MFPKLLRYYTSVQAVLGEPPLSIPAVAAAHADAWYATRDFAFYETVEYAWCSWRCWKKFTRATCNVLAQYLQSIAWSGTILDAYGGIGVSSAQLATALPQCTVLHHGATTLQAEVGQKLANDLGLTNMRTVQIPVECDLLLTCEVMEHFEQPLVELARLLSPRTSLYCYNNSFKQRAAGHFDTYVFGAEHVPNYDAAKHFRAHCKSLGFVKAVALYNNRPTILRRLP